MWFLAWKLVTVNYQIIEKNMEKHIKSRIKSVKHLKTEGFRLLHSSTSQQTKQKTKKEWLSFPVPELCNFLQKKMYLLLYIKTTETEEKQKLPSIVQEEEEETKCNLLWEIKAVSTFWI